MKMKYSAFILAGFLLFGVGIYIQTQVWNECREGGHSRLYCMALVSHK